ncbi:MAG: hypothetical protein JW891_12405 [Candidatus Lokiarchaeota archaeon]|nr:hypothetical protein [Candidatus Lokiarchaeota archaeon]
MPLGYIICRWSQNQGLIIPASYPEKMTVDLDDMMRVFYAHVTGAGAEGNVVVRLERSQCNVASYFTGMDSADPIMINLMLSYGEDPEMFGEAYLKEINEEILKYTPEISATNMAQSYEVIKRLKEYLKLALFQLERLKSLTKEQKLAQIYSSEKGRAILEFLQERARPRKELLALLEDKLGRIIANIDYTLEPFVKTSLVHQDWIAGLADVFLFLKSDVIISRIPPVKLVDQAKRGIPNPFLGKQYLDALKVFYAQYKPTVEDNLIVANNLMNPDKYDYIVLFREKPYPLNKIPKGPGESFKFIKNMLKSMEEDKVITIVKDKKGTEWVFLLSDLWTNTFYPEYMVDQIRNDRRQGLLKKEVALMHLKLLEKEYPKIK